jgi:multidrug efflux pump subunit AcrA (membrane-fusion protein)
MKARTMLAGVLLVLGFGVAARAQRADSAPAPPSNARFGDPSITAPNYQDYHYGVIKSVGESTLVCDKTEFGDDQPFRVEKKTKFTRDGKASTASALKAGDKVWMKIRTDKRTGEMTALKVVSGVFDARLK